MRRRGFGISRFLEDLSNGDPIALGMVAAVAVVAVVLGLLVLKARRDMKREDEAAARRYGRKMKS